MDNYNTQKPNIILKEYGRNVQDIIAEIRKEDDKNRRTQMCYGLVELMKLINPNLSKDPSEYNHKIWDHLFIISGFDLDVDAPYPIPDKSVLDRKPDKVDYNTNDLKFKHYGKNVILLAEEIAAIEDPKEKKDSIIYLVKLMKRYFMTWNRDTPDNNVIVKNLEAVSNGKLTLDLSEIDEKLLDVKVDTPSNNNNNNNNRGGGRNNNRNNNRNNQRGNNKRKKR